ncbi:class A beta-lactamase-related serine hydrolase, partial [bacterium]
MFGIGAGRPSEIETSRRSARAIVMRAARLVPPIAAIICFSPAALAQETRPAPPSSPPAIERHIDAFVARLEAKRKELGVVGAAVVVVHGDWVVRIAGLGQRNLESPAPITADTVFPMASVTKQFTAIAVALAVGEGKMAFEDHPRRFVPDFRLKDPDADANLILIDLLAHRSGLDRSDFTFLFGSFTQDELLQLAGR